MLEEVKTLAEGIQKGIAEIRSEVNSVKGDVAAHGDLNAKVEKMSEQTLKSLELIQELQRKQAAYDAAAARLDTASDKGAKDAEIEKSKAVLREYMLKGDRAKLEGFKLTDDGLEIRTMQTNVGPEGGYLTMPTLANFMVDRVFETTPMRSLANVVTIGGKSLDVIIDDNEAASGWANELATISATAAPNLGRLNIPVHKLTAKPACSTEMIEDGMVDIEAWLAGKLAEKFSRDENTAFVSGNGVDRPRGFTTFANYTSAGVYQREAIERIPAGSTTALSAEGLLDLQQSLKEEYQATATWLMRRQTFGNVLKLKGADNFYFNTTLMRDGQLQLQLLGRPVVFAADMPAIASGALPVAYGDFARAYTIVDRVGLSILRDPYSTDEAVIFKARKRVGGNVTSFDAMKLQVMST